MAGRGGQGGEGLTTWGVAGGGMLGLTLALRLAQQGHRVTVFEAADRIGGVADAWRLGDVTWDRHYHVICASDSALRELLRELGLEHRIEWVETRTGFYDSGRLVSISSNFEILRNLPMNLWQKLRLGAAMTYISQIRRGRRLEKVPVTDWLKLLSGARVFELLWLPLLKAKLGDNYRVASAAFIWAVARRLSRARRMGLDKERFGYVPGGYRRVLDQLCAALADAGVEVRLEAPVRRVAALPSPASGSSADGVTVTIGDGEYHRFDQVAVTLPAPIAARVIPGLDDDERARFEGITYQGIVCASMLLRRPLAGYYLTYITDAVPFSAVVEMSALVDPESFGGRGLVYLPKYVRSDDPLLDAPDEEIEGSFRPAFERMFPGVERDDVLCFRISRVRHLLALATLDYSDRLPPVTTSVPGVHVVNSAHIVNGTLNVNETVQLAQRAAARLGGA